METNTWEPVALIPATLSDDSHTTVEVVQTRGGIYLQALAGDSEARDCCMTTDEARRMALAILAAVGPEPTKAPSKGAVVTPISSARSAGRAGQVTAYLRAAA